METNLCFQGIQFDLETACIFCLVLFFSFGNNIGSLKEQM